MARPRLKLLLVLLAVCTVAVVCAVPDARRVLLQSAGRSLVADDPAEPVDIIVISVDAQGAGVLEAADLVHRGLAGRVALFSEPPRRIDREFMKRGMEYHDATALAMRQLKALGVPVVEPMPKTAAGTEDEALFLPGWCDGNGFRTIIFISTSDHSRRTRRVLQRAMLGHGTRVLVRYSRYSEFNPDTWWSTRDGVRTEIIEFEKLLLDVLSHPLS
jgi:uncharacterized SAM-binding protein YcdF (DUF218 family)